jgi:hypothetical protein
VLEDRVDLHNLASIYCCRGLQGDNIYITVCILSINKKILDVIDDVHPVISRCPTFLFGSSIFLGSYPHDSLGLYPAKLF